MDPVEATDDYYAILEVHQTASITDIKKSYHQLALMRHPDKNQNKPDATASFQLLNRAYETLKDESSRRIYDVGRLQIPKTYQRAQGRAKQDTGAAKAEGAKFAKERVIREAERRKSRSTIEGLVKKKQVFESEIFAVMHAITRLKLELKNIQTLEEKALAEERARNRWSKRTFSSVFDTRKKLENAKQEREMQRLQRLAIVTIKEKELSRGGDKIEDLYVLLSGVEKEIATEILISREREERWRREELRAKIKREGEFKEQERAAEEQRKKEEEQQKKKEEKLKREEEWRKKEEERLEIEKWLKREAKQKEERRIMVAEIKREKEEYERRKRERKEAEKRCQIIADILRQKGEEYERQKKEAKDAEKWRAEMLRETNATSDATTPKQSGA